MNQLVPLLKPTHFHTWHLIGCIISIRTGTHLSLLPPYEKGSMERRQRDTDIDKIA